MVRKDPMPNYELMSKLLFNENYTSLPWEVRSFFLSWAYLVTGVTEVKSDEMRQEMIDSLAHFLAENFDLTADHTAIKFVVSLLAEEEKS